MALPTISMLINTGLANKLQKTCVWRFRQPTAVPRLDSHGPTSPSLSLSLQGRLVYEGQVKRDAGMEKRTLE